MDRLDHYRKETLEAEKIYDHGGMRDVLKLIEAGQKYIDAMHTELYHVYNEHEKLRQCVDTLHVYGTAEEVVR